MVKRLSAVLALMLALLCAFPSALCEEFSGKTAFAKTRYAYADFEGTIESMHISPGVFVQAGEKAYTLETKRLYAQQDATVLELSAQENSVLPDVALCLAPKEKYKLLASVSYAYDINENKLAHAGETVYVSCVKDASHLAIGYIASVDGDEFTVYTTHGALYVGEAVNVFRAKELGYLNRIGRATVYAAEEIPVQAEGAAVRLYVQEGDRVEKGEALMDYLPGKNAPVSPLISAEEDGIITEVFAEAGDKVSPGDILYEYAAYSDIGVLLEVNQADMSYIVLGARAEVVFLIDSEEKTYDVIVTAITPADSENEGTYRVVLSLDAPPDWIREGLSVRLSCWKQPGSNR